jgi:hypothetical protein
MFPLKDGFSHQVLWLTPVIPALRRLRQKDCEFEAILGYIVHLRCYNSWRILISVRDSGTPKTLTHGMNKQW